MNVVTLPRREAVHHQAALPPASVVAELPLSQERKAFLGAICAEPLGYTSRPVYTDWLEENRSGDLDEELVEFIRWACSGITRRANASSLTAARTCLATNWPRLIPSLVVLNDQPRGDAGGYASNWTARPDDLLQVLAGAVGALVTPSCSLCHSAAAPATGYGDASNTPSPSPARRSGATSRS
jgi:uncharacterized protein (TIGR02996 family)